MRVATRTSATEEAALQFDSQLKRLLRDARAEVRRPTSVKGDLNEWRSIIARFLDLVSRPVLNALSHAYQHGSRLDDVIEDVLEAIGKELAVDGDPVGALKRLSELDAVRILTIHKSKGLEFEKVVVLGIEEELFWGDAATSEFFVAISRAKDELALTHADFRARPSTPVKYWRENRTAHIEFLAYANEDLGDESQDGDEPPL
jgi:superfamily I DNA/RNA helicase